jgi:hypothetical protein
MSDLFQGLCHVCARAAPGLSKGYACGRKESVPGSCLDSKRLFRVVPVNAEVVRYARAVPF